MNNPINSQGKESYKGIDYYKSKEYQVFPQYNLAIKCPVKLVDGSNQTSKNYDFIYSGFEKSKF